MNPYLALTKPKVTWLILMSTGVGFFFGLQDRWRGWPDALALVNTIIGTGLIASASAALNQWFEREADRKMRRTEKRPLPSGALTPRSAFWFAIALAAAGFALLALAVNLLSGLLGIATLLSYCLIYTPLKQRTSICTIVGALPGAMPPMIGYAAASGKLTPEAWALFAILFLWQFPHFLAIAWMYREDYARAGIRMLPVVEPDGQSTSRQMVIYASTLIPVSLFPTVLGMSGRIYMIGALLLGGWFLYSGVRVLFQRTILNARKVLLVSVIYLPAMWVLMILDHARS
jgi:protoheme IX farnesyltransferase